MTEALLEISGLSIAFRSDRGLVQAVRNVDLSVPHRRVVGIVGESGCGKSTLISAILGLLAPSAVVNGGRIDFGGRNLLEMSDEDMEQVRGRRIAMVFQDPMTSLNPVLSIGTQMVDIQYRDPRSYAEKRQRAADMLRQVGIPDAEERLDLFPHQFSGGMRQRIAIGMALLMQPELLIADEPTTALDVTLEAQIAQLLLRLRESFSGSILFVSHNLGLVAELCDEIAVMYAGEVVEAGPVERLFADPRHPYTRLLLDCDPARIAGRMRELPSIPGVVPDLVSLPSGCIFAPRCPDAIARCRVDSPSHHAVAADHTARCHLVADASVA